MSPIGKSGKYHMNPHHMRAVGDAPDEKSGGEMKHSPADEKGHDGKGDGRHHHEVTKHEDGSYSSVHTHPDGQKEHMDHPDFHHAVRHMADKMEEEPAMEHEEPDGDEGVEADSGESKSPLESMYE